MNNYNAPLIRPPRRLIGFRTYNPIVRERVEYPRFSQRRGRDFDRFCSDLFKKVAATLKREFADVGRYLPELRSKWKIREAVEWHFEFFRPHQKTGRDIKVAVPEWLISELQRGGSWRPRLRKRRKGVR